MPVLNIFYPLKLLSDFFVTKDYKTLLEGSEEFIMSELNHNFFLLEVDVRDVQDFLADALESTQPGNQARGSLLNPKRNTKKILFHYFFLGNLTYVSYCSLYEIPSTQEISPKESTRWDRSFSVTWNQYSRLKLLGRKNKTKKQKRKKKN